MKLGYILLGLLSWQRRDGYEIVKWLDNEGAFLRSRIHHSQVYRELGKMVISGWVTFDTDPREGRPDAKVYTVTPTGHAALLDWVRSPYIPPSRFQDVDFTVRFTFALHADLAAAQEIALTELNHRKMQVAVNRRQRRPSSPAEEMTSADEELVREVTESVIRFGEQSIDAWVSWLESLAITLKSTEPSSARPA